MTSPRAADPVRRSVFYLPGLDPAGPARYQGLLRREAGRHNDGAENRIAIGAAACTEAGTLYWDISSETSQGGEKLRYYFFDWTDIARHALERSVSRTLIDFAFYSSRILWRLFVSFDMKNGRPFALCCLYSAIVVCLYFVAGLGFAAFAYFGLRSLFGDVGALIVTVVVLFLMIRSSVLLEPKTFAYFFLRTLNFSHRFARRMPDALSARLAEFAKEIRTRLDQGDEVVIVGHSYGALLTPTLIEYLSGLDGELPGAMPGRLKVVNLGSLHPLITLDPGLNWYKRAVDRMANSGVHWIEVFSGYDALNFPHFDPRTENVCDAAAPEFRDVNFFEHRTPSIFSPMRYRIFNNHFRYLMARDRFCRFDYFDYLFANDVTRYWNPPPDGVEGA